MLEILNYIKFRTLQFIALLVNLAWHVHADWLCWQCTWWLTYFLSSVTLSPLLLQVSGTRAIEFSLGICLNRLIQIQCAGSCWKSTTGGVADEYNSHSKSLQVYLVRLWSIPTMKVAVTVSEDQAHQLLVTISRRVFHHLGSQRALILAQFHSCMPGSSIFFACCCNSRACVLPWKTLLVLFWPSRAPCMFRFHMKWWWYETMKRCAALLVCESTLF